MKRLLAVIVAASFALGSGYALWTIYWESHVTNSSVLLIILAVTLTQYWATSRNEAGHGR